MIKSEIKNYNQIPIVIVGNKKDVRNEDYYERKATVEEGE